MAPAAKTRSSQLEGAKEASEKYKKKLLDQHMKKTSLCYYFQNTGSCKYGGRCDFAHGEAELQTAPDLRKTRLCRAFAAGNCRRGDCSFAHGQQELSPTGFCYKTALCSWHARGRCANGTDCRFAHGQEELRSIEDPVPQVQPARDRRCSLPAALPGALGSPAAHANAAKGQASERLPWQSAGARLLTSPLALSGLETRGTATDSRDDGSQSELARSLACLTAVSQQLESLHQRLDSSALGDDLLKYRMCGSPPGLQEETTCSSPPSSLAQSVTDVGVEVMSDGLSDTMPRKVWGTFCTEFSTDSCWLQEPPGFEPLPLY